MSLTCDRLDDASTVRYGHDWLLRKDEKLKGHRSFCLRRKLMKRIYGTETRTDAYLAKPFNDRELKAEVRNLLALKTNERRVVELNTYLTESVLKRFCRLHIGEQGSKRN